MAVYHPTPMPHPHTRMDLSSARDYVNVAPGEPNIPKQDYDDYVVIDPNVPTQPTPPRLPPKASHSALTNSTSVPVIDQESSGRNISGSKGYQRQNPLYHCAQQPAQYGNPPAQQFNQSAQQFNQSAQQVHLPAQQFYQPAQHGSPAAQHGSPDSLYQDIDEFSMDRRHPTHVSSKRTSSVSSRSPTSTISSGTSRTSLTSAMSALSVTPGAGGQIDMAAARKKLKPLSNSTGKPSESAIHRSSSMPTTVETRTKGFEPPPNRLSEPPATSKAPPQTLPKPCGGRPSQVCLESQSWFYATIQREQAEEMIRKSNKDGCFVVRYASGGQNPNFPYTVTLCYKARVFNLKVRRVSDQGYHQYALGYEKQTQQFFPTVTALVDHHRIHEILLGSTEGQLEGRVRLTDFIKH